MLKIVRRLMMRKTFLVIVVLALTGTAHAANWIQFPVSTLGQGQTAALDITGHLDAESALGVQVIVTLNPIMWFGGTVTMTGLTTTGSTFELVEGANWLDFSDASTGFLGAMTLDWTTANVSGNLIVGSITLSASPDALGVMGIEVVHLDPEGYLDNLGGAFGTLYNGEVGVVPIPEPTTLVLVGLGLLGAWRRRHGRVESRSVNQDLSVGGQER
jgi:hypothetical protein